MRNTFCLLFLSCLFLTSMSQAQLTWSKRSYAIANFRGERADFTGDGFPDLLLFSSTNLTIVPNTGNGTFDVSKASVSNQQANTVALLDFNRDGKTDVAVCDGKNMVIMKGNGNGTLTATQTVPVACASIVSADFNGDGNPDVAVAVPDFSNSGHDQVVVYLGDGSGIIASTVVNDGVEFSSSDGNPCNLNGLSQAADFNGDKNADIVIDADCPNGTVTADALVVGLGDGAGHFTFHRDLEYNFSFLRSHLIDANNDRKKDIIALGLTGAPHGFNGTTLAIFRSNGDGTFTQQIVTQDSVDGDTGTAIDAFAYGDFDGDGTNDVVIELDTEGLQTPAQVFSFQFFKGQSDGSFKMTQTSPLATQVLDMVPGDYDKDGREDVVLLRQRSTDVWLNQTPSSPICGALGNLRSVNFCSYGSPGGTFHFVANPLDSRQINAMQVYVDGTLKFETPNDLLNTKIFLVGGTHRITAKAWDDLGAFSTTVNLLACTNDVFRTVKICLPANDSSSGNAVHIVASAATSLAFSQLQVYFDGVVRFRTSSKYVDISPDLSLGTHRITVKGWDSNGAFSSSASVTVK